MKKRLKALASRWHDCKRCGLHEERAKPNIVFGIGRNTAKYLLVYDAPTDIDVEFAQPMSGREGDLLAELLEKAGIEFADVYCTPLLGCRPTLYVPETADQVARIMDRGGTAKEFAACAPRVTELIYQIDPLVIFTMGDDAWRQLVATKDRGQAKSLDKAIGDLFVARVTGRWLPEIIYDVIPLLSMKQIIAQPSFAAHGPIATTINHLTKGRMYGEFVEKTGLKDAQAAGFAPTTQGEAAP